MSKLFLESLNRERLAVYQKLTAFRKIGVLGGGTALTLQIGHRVSLNKAFLLGRRPKWRDYVDLYFLLRGRYLGLNDLIVLGRKKFGTDFSEKLFLEQLVYWRDIGSWDVEFINKKVAPEEIKLSGFWAGRLSG